MADYKNFLGLNPREYGIPEALAADIELIDQLLGRLLVTEGEQQVIDIARALYEQCSATNESGHEPLESAQLTDEVLTQFPALNDSATVSRVLRAFTILFQLVNTAEQKEIVHANRKRQARQAAEVLVDAALARTRGAGR